MTESNESVFIVSSEGIKQATFSRRYEGGYKTKLVIPKDTFIEAFTEYILKPCKEAKENTDGNNN